MFKFFNKRIITTALAIIIIIFLHYAGILPPLENYLIKFLQPVERIFFHGGNALNTAYQNSAGQKDWEAFSKDLQAENKELLEENTRLKVLAEENKALREQLSFFSQHHYQKVTANVISRSGSAGENQVIILDRGAKDGIAPSQPIVVGNGFIAGKIFSVQAEISYGCLITQPACRFAAALIDQPETSGLTNGELGLTVRLDFIPQPEEIKLGGVVVTSGLEAAIPRGLIIGRVQSVAKEANNLFQAAVINPEINLNNLAVVAVITN